ncbi:ribonuclease P protein component [Petrotoga sp. 9PWA.NaAc.5.4]|uniref:ribonuclease P protein component n=1 Tax=Petrotoga sp. 9PWA.NaAc.5.4 TaxID=1434328 RepID=UPI000CB06684|nr:ribonuclease P protein component [Petrotoga sp. 9PWA.NaAc.5.4]PNR94629.1 ribonuclease P [Petrotoga sp. 9PWA.NaAc.5.4]
MENNKFSKKERIRYQKDIKKVFEKGDRLINIYFVAVYLKNGLNYSRIAIVVRKKFGKANQRNKIKRYVREIYRTNKSEFPKGYDLIFLPRKYLSDNFNNISYAELRESILTAFKELKLNDEKFGSKGNQILSN